MCQDWGEVRVFLTMVSFGSTGSMSLSTNSPHFRKCTDYHLPCGASMASWSGEQVTHRNGRTFWKMPYSPMGPRGPWKTRVKGTAPLIPLLVQGGSSTPRKSFAPVWPGIFKFCITQRLGTIILSTKSDLVDISKSISRTLEDSNDLYKHLTEHWP